MMRAFLSVCFLLLGASAHAQELPTQSLDLNTTGGPQELAATL